MITAKCLWPALGLLLLAPLAAQGVQKGASITLRARWQGTPYLLEAAEFLVRHRMHVLRAARPTGARARGCLARRHPRLDACARCGASRGAC
jgi:hypothetical protein